MAGGRTSLFNSRRSGCRSRRFSGICSVLVRAGGQAAGPSRCAQGSNDRNSFRAQSTNVSFAIAIARKQDWLERCSFYSAFPGVNGEIGRVGDPEVLGWNGTRHRMCQDEVAQLTTMKGPFRWNLNAFRLTRRSIFPRYTAWMCMIVSFCGGSCDVDRLNPFSPGYRRWRLLWKPVRGAIIGAENLAPWVAGSS